MHWSSKTPPASHTLFLVESLLFACHLNLDLGLTEDHISSLFWDSNLQVEFRIPGNVSVCELFPRVVSVPGVPSKLPYEGKVENNIGT